MFVCRFCKQEKKNHNSFRNHERLCPSNPERVYKNGMQGKIPWNKGLDKTDPRVAKGAASISEALKGKPSKTVWTDEMRKAKSEWRKQLHLDNPESHPNRKLAANKKNWTYPEKVCGDWFDKHNIIYERNKRIGRYYPDFIVGSLIIEIDGEYWHDVEKDRIRDKYLSDLGYTVHRIKAKEHIEQRLKELLGVG